VRTAPILINTVAYGRNKAVEEFICMISNIQLFGQLFGVTYSMILAFQFLNHFYIFGDGLEFGGR
jgi:hypothetical protein